MSAKDLAHWLFATLIACLAAGASGILSTLLLKQTSAWAAYLVSLESWMLPLMLLCVGVIAGGIWWWIRLKKGGSIVGVVRQGEEDLLLGRSALDAALQVTSVGFGTSMGREAAPRLLASALTWNVTARLSRDIRVLATAGAAGGALGTVYDAPWAGALYTLTILLPSLEWRTVMSAVCASWAGVGMAQLLLGTHNNYPLGKVETNIFTWVWVVITILCAPALGLGFKALQKRFISGKVPHKILPLTLALSFGMVGLVGVYRPEILGNGVAVVQHALAGDLGLETLLLLILLKAVLTVLVLNSGAVGGVLMPAFALGAAFGGAGAVLLPQSNLAVFVVVAATAVLSVTEKSWMFAVCFGLELVDAPVNMWFPVICAGVGAYCVSAWANRAKL